MSSVESCSVVSGLPYLVLSVDGRPPASLEDVATGTHLVLDNAGSPLSAVGTASLADGVVRFYEKAGDAGGRDVRVWRVVRRRDGGIVASHDAAF